MQSTTVSVQSAIKYILYMYDLLSSSVVWEYLKPKLVSVIHPADLSSLVCI